MADYWIASGELKIAEVTSRFTNVKDFVALVESLGFQLTKQVSQYRLLSNPWKLV